MSRLGRILNKIPQRLIVHKNTWFSAQTYHWDFSVKDFEEMIKPYEINIIKSYSTHFPIPYFSILKNKRIFFFLEKILCKFPLTRYFGCNLVIILEKE